ncbi:MAG: Dipeptide transport system permease protein DppC [uncultured Thermomicrobiales bacterium]|uniref:Dipeptide transport system permease protein DppC n=1 Tax=uncultured Thermomicrobiales bacterium TaxID=1645740 RepID=A0A6J4VFN9_9BACT|nr:MAG: Dipeptide transport system permease protein DppC [uncultured Thermomicrobiales bacterium]
MIGSATGPRAVPRPAGGRDRAPGPNRERSLATFDRARRERSRWRWVGTISPLVGFCLVVLALFVVGAVFADAIAPHAPTRNYLLGRLRPPAFVDGGSPEHLLGTDELGRDLLSRLIHGARVSLAIAALGTLFGAAFGALCGLAAGFARGRLDELMMLLVDAYIALPFLIVALVVVAMLGSSLRVLILLAALAGWASYTRVSRGLALRARQEQYVLAARALGAGPLRLVLRHVLPNVVAPLVVLATFELTGIILLEASLSFLGFGVQPPTPAWGLMVSEGREFLHTAWWVGVFPGLVIMLVAIAVSLSGDWLREVLDPMLRSKA